MNFYITNNFQVNNLFFFLLQDDDNALLQQALAMSMDDTSSNVTARDTDMPEAAADDHELQLGKVLNLLA